MAPVGGLARDPASVALSLDDLTDVTRHSAEEEPHRYVGERDRESEGHRESDGEQKERCERHQTTFRSSQEQTACRSGTIQGLSLLGVMWI